MKAFIEVALMWGIALAVVLAVFLLCISCPWNHRGVCGDGYGMDTEFWR